MDRSSSMNANVSCALCVARRRVCFVSFHVDPCHPVLPLPSPFFLSFSTNYLSSLSYTDTSFAVHLFTSFRLAIDSNFARISNAEGKSAFDKGDCRRGAATFPIGKNERVNSREKNPDGKYPAFARSFGKIPITRTEILTLAILDLSSRFVYEI